VDGFDHAEWDFLSSLVKNGHVTLQSEAPGQVSLIQTPFSLQPNTLYNVAFQARLIDDTHAGAPLIVDIAGDHYDSPEQEMQLALDKFSNQFQDFNVDLQIGKTVPPLAYLRLFTLSTQPYEIRNVKLIQNENSSPRLLPVGKKTDITQLEPLYNSVHKFPDGIEIYENPGFLPRARFVEKIRVVKNAAAATKILWNRDKFDPVSTALVEEYNGPKDVEHGDIISADYSNPSRVTLSVETGKIGFLVLSDSWYPGWKAFIDNQETKIYKTNAVSRGILITEPGKHTVIFQFVPKSFYLGLLITAMTLAGFVLYLFLDRIKRRIKRSQGH
jgi:hypothetical protein